MQLSTDCGSRTLRRALEPVRINERRSRRSADSLTAPYLNDTSDVHRAILAESDSLVLGTAPVPAEERGVARSSFGSFVGYMDAKAAAEKPGVSCQNPIGGRAVGRTDGRG